MSRPTYLDALGAVDAALRAHGYAWRTSGERAHWSLRAWRRLVAATWDGIDPAIVRTCLVELLEDAKARGAIVRVRSSRGAA